MRDDGRNNSDEITSHVHVFIRPPQVSPGSPPMRKLQRSVLASAVALGTRRLRQRRSAVLECLFLRRQPERFGQLQVDASAGNRFVHDQPWSRLVAGVRAAFRFRRDSIDSRAAITTHMAVRASPCCRACSIRRSRRPRPCPSSRKSAQYTAKGPADSNAIYSVQGGGNDFFYQFGLLLAGADVAGAGAGRRSELAAVQLGSQVAIAPGGRGTLHHGLDRARHGQRFSSGAAIGPGCHAHGAGQQFQSDAFRRR